MTGVWSKAECEAALIGLMRTVHAATAHVPDWEARSEALLAAFVYKRLADHVVSGSTPAMVQAELEILARIAWETGSRWSAENRPLVINPARLGWWLRERHFEDHGQSIAKRLKSPR